MNSSRIFLHINLFKFYHRNVHTSNILKKYVVGLPTRRNDAAIPEISVPQKYQKVLDKKLNMKNKVGQEIMTLDNFLEKRGPPELLIACKEKRKNHYVGYTYAKWSEDKLASCKWKRSSTVDDYFVICSHGTIPAFLNDSKIKTFSISLWEKLGLNTNVTDCLNQQNYQEPTSIQCLAIPKILFGNNIICAGETGSGKTLAYLLPLIQKCLQHNKQNSLDSCKSPKVIVLAPSVLLRDQITSVAKELCKDLPLNIEKLESNQIKDDSSSQWHLCDILVALPDHLCSAIKNDKINVSHLHHLVLDEADLILDLREQNTIKTILRYIPVHRGKESSPDERMSDFIGTQLILVGASLPANAANALSDILPIENFEKVTSPFTHQIVPCINQKFIRTTLENKPAQLLKHLFRNVKERNSPLPTIVFCNTKESLFNLHRLLTENSIVHSTTSKSCKANSFDDFQKQETHVLLTTDSGAHGLDTTRARFVINYEFPSFITEYIHRVGRVGRVKSQGSGTVINFICKDWEVDLVRKIETCYRREMPLPNIGTDIRDYLASKVDSEVLENKT